MCLECGCGRPDPARIDGELADSIHSPLVDALPVSSETGRGHSHGHSHPHADHDHHHDHDHDHHHDAIPGHEHPPEPRGDHPETSTHRVVEVHQALLARNDLQAERNRGFFRALGVLTINVVSAPGSGKTELLRRTITTLGTRLRVGVIVGDVATDNDARRLRDTGAAVVQITTGTLCHLDAGMVARAVGRLDARNLDLLFLENVGNLVCPAAFDLGEDLRVVLLSVTEGEDKPLKYPPLFHSAHAAVVTKTDLSEAAGFNRETVLRNIRRVSHHAEVFELSARSGQGMEDWCRFLEDKHRQAAGRPPGAAPIPLPAIAPS